VFTCTKSVRYRYGAVGLAGLTKEIGGVPPVFPSRGFPWGGVSWTALSRFSQDPERELEYIGSTIRVRGTWILLNLFFIMLGFAVMFGLPHIADPLQAVLILAVAFSILDLTLTPRHYAR
jgi:hypothetical protein